MKNAQLFIMLLFLFIFQTNMSFEMVAAKTPEELYRESDVILVGKITTAKENVEQRVTDYTMSVEKYLKNDTNAPSLSIVSRGVNIVTFGLKMSQFLIQVIKYCCISTEMVMFTTYLNIPLYSMIKDTVQTK